MPKFKVPPYWKQFQARLKKSGKKICWVDCETCPAIAYVWRIGECYVSHEQLVSPVKVISVQYMFEGDKKPTVLHWDQKNKCDRKLLTKIVPILAEADVIIAQNGDRFDIKVWNERLRVHQLTPLTNCLTLDTLKLSRGSFYGMSHKLDYRAKTLGMSGKIPMSFDDWRGVMEDRPGALEKMLRYGEHDIPLLRNTFIAELPYYRNLPGWFRTFLDNGSTSDCPICGAHSTRHGYRGGSLRLICENGHVWQIPKGQFKDGR